MTNDITIRHELETGLYIATDGRDAAYANDPVKALDRLLETQDTNRRDRARDSD